MSAKFVPKLPEKWSEYSEFGEIIPGTNILCTKTPLKDEYFAENAEAEQKIEKFTPEDLKTKVEERFNKRVGLVIDLTNTNKYYHALDICKIAADYYKMNIEGREVPAEPYVQQFIRVVDAFNKFVREGGNPDQFTTDDEPPTEPVIKPVTELPTEPTQTETKAEEKTSEVKAEETGSEVKPAEGGEETKTDDVAPPVDEAEEQRRKEQLRFEREQDRLFSRFYPKNMPDISQCVAKPFEDAAEADSYSNEMTNSPFVIVVHCTHGVNRSGYLIARYLLDRFAIPAADVIQRIAAARGHEFDRDYLSEVLHDDELLAMVRLQMQYSYLSDKGKYFEYKPGMRFKNPKFATWKKNAKRRADDGAEEPEAKLAKVEENQETEYQVVEESKPVESEPVKDEPVKSEETATA